MGWGQLLGGAAGFFLGGPAGAVLGASLGGAAEEVTGGGASGAAREAAATTGAAADRATDLQREMFERQVALQEPFRQAGVNALNKLAPLASKYTPFGMSQFRQDPGYAFRMSEGMKGLERSAAARGGLLSGATLKGIQRFGQDLGSQEYQNAFNRYQTERSARLNPLQSLAGVGQTSANTIGQAGAQFANTAGNIGINQSNVAANALLAGQQARSSSYGQLGNVLGKYLGGGGSFGGSSGSFQADPGAYAFGTQYWE
jgi:hypothetical protein